MCLSHIKIKFWFQCFDINFPRHWLQNHKSTNPIHTGYKLHGHTLESVPGGKYLGVHVNKDLSWNDHIQQTSAKAWDVKAQAYTTLVRPEYASTVWDPYTLQQIYALEWVQRQAARFVTGDYSSRPRICYQNAATTTMGHTRRT